MAFLRDKCKSGVSQAGNRPAKSAVFQATRRGRTPGPHSPRIRPARPRHSRQQPKRSHGTSETPPQRVRRSESKPLEVSADANHPVVRLTLTDRDTNALAAEHAHAEVFGRTDKAARIPPEDYYLRITPLFESGARECQWLNDVVAIGYGRTTGSGIVYEIFALA